MDTQNLRLEVQSLVDEVEKTHRYSMSRIYGAYNKVFGREEVPQACASCLIRKMRELKRWLEANKEQTVETKPALATEKKRASRKKLATPK